MTVDKKLGSFNSMNSGPKSAFSNAGWNAFFTVFSGVIGLLLTPLLIHYLGVSQYGILLIVWSVTGILQVADLGLGEATLRYVAYHFGDGNWSGVNRVIGSTLSFYLVICAVITTIILGATSTIVGFLNIPPNEHLLVGWLIRISTLVFSISLISNTFGAVPRAILRYDISSKISICESVLRSIGYILLVITKFGILHLVLWDVVVCLATLSVRVVVISKLAPGIRLFPSFSFKGLKEIIGYSVYSFLTYFFLKVFRESGKLVLGRHFGPSAVAYLGAPDNFGQRIHTIVASGTETLLPRFSSNRDPQIARALFMRGTWVALVFSIIFFIPIIILMPDFLSLWISPKFSLESAEVGRLLAVSYISQGAFAPAATFFRGSGMPWVVSIVLFFAGFGTLLMCMLLVPVHGVLGVGYAFLLGSCAHFLGLLGGWILLFRKSSLVSFFRTVGVPLLMAGVAFILESAIRARLAEMTWIRLIALGGLFAGLTALLIFCVDWLIGGDSPSKMFLDRLGESDKLRQLLNYIPAWRIR